MTLTETIFHLNITLPLLLALLLWGICWLPIKVIAIKRLHMRGQGLALPGIILLTPSAWDREEVLRHELMHQQQYRRYSPIGVALILAWHYGYGFLKGRIRNGHWPTFWQLWQTNPLEIEANNAMFGNQDLPSFKKLKDL